MLNKSEQKNKILYLTLILLLAFMFVLDRFFKYIIIKGEIDQPLIILKDIFQLSFAKNYFIAFSLPIISGAILNIVIIALLILLFCYFFYLLKKGEKREVYYLGFVILGAFSNLADRFRFGYVIDYFDLKYFTVFNIADIMIVGGCVGIVISQMINSRKKINATK